MPFCFWFAANVDLTERTAMQVSVHVRISDIKCWMSQKIHYLLMIPNLGSFIQYNTKLIY